MRTLPLSRSVCVALAALPGVALADPLDVVVRERGSGVPVPSAAVVVDGRTLETDARGRVSLDHAPGTVSVRVVCALYEPAEQLVEVGGEPAEIWLRPETAEEITVVGAAREASVQQQTVGIDELRSVPGSFGDPIRALQSLPAVARPRSVEGALVVRGAEARNTRAYVDGVEVPFLYHLLAGKSVLSPSVLERVDFYPGGVPIQYGDVGQAVVDARTPDAPPEAGGLHGDAHLDLMEVGSAVQIPLGGFDLRLSGRISWLSGIARAVQLTSYAASAARDAFHHPAGLRVPYSDYYARLQHPAGAHGRVYLTAFGADDGLHTIPERYDLDEDGSWDPIEPLRRNQVDRTDLLENHFARAVVGWEVDGPTVQQRTQLALGRDAQRNIVPGLGVFATTPQDLDTQTLGAWLSHRDRIVLTDGLAWASGLDARLRSTTLRELGVGPAGDEVGPPVEDRQLWLGPYAGVEGTVGPLEVSPGVRGAVHRIVDRTLAEVEPRLQTRLHLSDHLRLRGFAGRHSEAPTPDTYAVQGAPVRLARVAQVGGGLQADQGAWTVSLDLYRSWFSDLVVASEVPVVTERDLYGFTSGLAFEPRFRVTTGAAYGGELLIRRLPGTRWSGWLALSAGRSVRRVGGELVPSDYDTPVDATLLLARELGKGFGAGGRLRVGAGQPYTPLQGVYVSSAELYAPIEGAPNSARLPLFFQLDLRLDKTWTSRSATWTVYLDVYNATNHPNPLVSTYTWDFAERRTVGWIPVLPTLGGSVSF
ncbi:MAG: TonB-dependent receptor [Myxococcota bacterium]